MSDPPIRRSADPPIRYAGESGEDSVWLPPADTPAGGRLSQREPGPLPGARRRATGERLTDAEYDAFMDAHDSHWVE